MVDIHGTDLYAILKAIPPLRWLVDPTIMVCSILYKQIMNPASSTEPVLDFAFLIYLLLSAWISITVTRFAIRLNLDFVEAIGLGSKHPRWSEGCAIMLTGLVGNLSLGCLTICYNASSWVLVWAFGAPAVFPLPTAIVVAWKRIRRIRQETLRTSSNDTPPLSA